MRSSRTSLVRLVALGLGLVPGPGAVLAQSFQVTPVQVELTPRARTAIVTIQNLGADPMRLQASAFEWRQDRRGETQLAPTRDVVFFPGLVTVAPGARRNLRVGAADGAPFAEVERAYRIFIEQLPGGPGAPQGMVRVLTRVGIPVYLSPPKPAPRSELSPIDVVDGKVSFILRNTGNVRIRPEAVKVVGRDGDGAAVFEQALPGWYVLSGDERVFEMQAPRDGCERVRTLSAEIQLGKSALQSQRPTASGVCAP